MAEKKRITIVEVAKTAGVSRQTVSRVLNSRPDVAAETRERVKQVIQQLGYQPSALARSLSQGVSCTLGVVGYGLEFFGNSRVLSEIEAQANDRGYTLALTLMHEPTKNDFDRFISELVARHVMGIIWAVPQIADNRNWLIDALRKHSVPTVCVSMQPHPDLSVVEVDNFVGSKLATQHLIENGCRKIGIITGPLEWWASSQRLAGWKAGMREAGLGVNPGWIFEGDWTARSGFLGAEKILKEFPDLEAIFACNDQIALGVQKTAMKLGIEIPGDLALVGYDNIPESEFYPISLTTIRQGFTELGKLSMEELERRIQIEREKTISTPKSVLIPPELIVRASSVR